MKKIKQLGRRSFLLNAGKGMFALWSEVSFGLGSRGLAVALGGSGLLTACTQPLVVQPEAAPTVAQLDPVQYAQIFTQFVNSYVLIRGNEAAIVDAGIAGTSARYAEVLTEAGMGWDAVNHLILTHYHGDHVGSMAEVMEATPEAMIYAGEADIPEILTPHSIQAVGDGDDVFGMQIINTPGHTAGHISVLDPVGSIFIAGDALTNVDGALSGPNERFTADMAMANESVRKISTFDFDTALFGHGDPLEGSASEAIAELAEDL